VPHNYLVGRTFSDRHNLNERAKRWCAEMANRKVKRPLGMSLEAAYLMEKHHLTPCPLSIRTQSDFIGIPNLPIPRLSTRSFIAPSTWRATCIHTNRCSAPERLIGKDVEAHKSWNRIEVFFKIKKVAGHPRLLDKRETRLTSSGHHSMARPVCERAQEPFSGRGREIPAEAFGPEAGLSPEGLRQGPCQGPTATAFTICPASRSPSSAMSPGTSSMRAKGHEPKTP
jgi:hypothetical protein